MKSTLMSIVFATCPYFRNQMGGTKKAFSDNSQGGYISLMVSRDIIPFDINVVAIGATSDNISSKRKTLDEVSLSSSKSKT